MRFSVAYVVVSETVNMDELVEDLTKHKQQAIILDCHETDEDFQNELQSRLVRDTPYHGIRRIHGNIVAHVIGSFVESLKIIEQPSQFDSLNVGRWHAIIAVKIFFTKAIMGRREWCFACTANNLYYDIESPADVAFIAKHQIRFCVGRVGQCFLEKVIKETCDRQIPVAVIPDPLSRMDIDARIICFGEYGKFENLAAPAHIYDLGPSRNCSPCVWPSIDLFGMKHVHAPDGMEKLLFYIGAERSYRTEKANEERERNMLARRNMLAELHARYG